MKPILTLKRFGPFAAIAVAAFVLAYVAPAVVAGEAPPEEIKPQVPEATVNSPSWTPLIWTQIGWLLLVGVVAPAYAAFAKRKDEKELRGLNLPRGSIRSMLALLIVGSFINILVFGHALGKDMLQIVVPAFSTLAGAVTGFYFGERTATPKPPDTPTP